MTRVILLVLAAWTAAAVALAAVIATVGHRVRTRLSPMVPRRAGPKPDPIGVASARLFGAGVDRRLRLVALRFLGVLLARAGDDGHIHCDPDDLVGLGILNGLLPEEVDRSRIWLEAVGVLERVPTGWFITGFAPVGDEVPPADVMAAIGRVLAKPVNDDEPVLAPVTTPAVTPVPPPSPSRFPSRWVAAPVGLAAAVLALALVLSGQVPLPLPGRPVSNSGNDVQRVESAQRATASTVPELSPLGSASTAVSAPASPGQAPAASAPGAASPSTVACPQGGVVAAVESMEQRVDGSVPSAVPASTPTTLPPVVRTVVSGTVRNTSSAAAVVRPFPVEVTFTDASGVTSQTVTATALAAPTTVAAGATFPWSVSVDTPPQNPVPAKAKAGAPTWRWDDATLAAACPR